ncbi:hypothetical protein BY458DRAFT_434909, partial [Sporodiniella umbellata]
TPILTGLSSKVSNCAHAGLVFPPLERLPQDITPVHPNALETSFFCEEAPRSAIWSPYGLSQSQSCFLTVITTKHRVNSKYALLKLNQYKLGASWSKALSTDVVGSQFALMALSNKGGNINIWAYSSKNGFQHSAQVTPYEAHTNHLDWTEWKKLNEHTFLSFVASGSTDGRVALSSVKLELIKENEDWKIKKVEAKCLYEWFDDNIAIPTFLKTASDFKNNASAVSIAVSKGSFIYLLSLRVDLNGRTKTEGDWTLHNMIHTGVGLSGGTWETPTIFRGYTFEGEGVCLELNNGIVEEDKTATHSLNQRLVQKFKQQWMEEQLKTEDDDVFGTSDAIPCLWGASDGINNIVTAVYCTLESAEDSAIIFILQKERGTNTQAINNSLRKYIEDPETVFNAPIRGALRETMEFLVDEENPDIFYAWLNQLQKYISSDFEASEGTFLRKLYGTPSVISSFIINTVELELKYHDFFKYSTQFVEASEKAKYCTKANYFTTILDYVLSLPDNDLCCLDQSEITDILLLLDQALLINNQNITEKSLKMYEKIESNFPGVDLKEEIKIASSFNPQTELIYTPKPREQCPVCDELVGCVTGTNLAQCNTGHIWELCCITYKVLAEPTIRKCLSCEAKSLKISDDKAFSDSILKMCSNCTHCGSSFFVMSS